MKVIFFDKVIFEGTEEEYKTFRKNLLDTLWKLNEELEDTYPMKKTDTAETYFEALKILNPFVYETLSYFKELAGDYFIGFDFYKMCLAGVGLWVYADLGTKRTKTYTLGYIYNIICFEIRKQTIWKIEE